MDDGLSVSLGGSVAVSTDGMLADAAQLGLAEEAISGWTRRLQALLDAWPDPPRLVLDHASAFGAVSTARLQLVAAADRIAELGSMLHRAALDYGAVEALVTTFWQLGGRIGAVLLGFGLRANPTVALSAGAGIGGVWIGGLLAPELTSANRARLLNDPAFVRLVRSLVDAGDEAVLGFAAPPGLGLVLGASIDAPSAAAAILALAGLGAGLGSRGLVETPVTVRAIVESPVVPRSGAGEEESAASPPAGSEVRPPRTFGELAARVPAAGAGDPQLRIEHYGDAWVVYVGGTADFSPEPGAEPWDLTSDVALLADPALVGDRAAGAERATREALARAGHEPGQPLVVVGHSAGGLVAARLAQDPALGVVGALSLGGPVAQIGTPAGVPVVSIEHEEDLVPALGGMGRDAGPDRVTVSRSALSPDERDDAGVPAHALARYRETAELADDSREAPLGDFLALVRRTTGPGPGTATRWRAERAPTG